MDIRRAFSANEHHERVERVGSLARARGLDGVLAWSRGGGTADRLADVLWLTNFYNPWLAVPDSQCWSGQSYAAALVTADGGCHLVTNIPRSEWSESLVVCDSSTDEPFIHEGAASVVRAAGLERARLGLAGRDALSVQLWELVRSALPDVVFVPADDLTSQARRRKSPAEMQLIREVGRVADGAMEAMLAASVPGATERDAVGAALSALVAAGGMPYSLAFETGPAAARYCPSTLPPWSERAMRAGDLWRVDMAGSLGGYIFDFARTTVVGSEPSAIQRQLIETAIAAVETVIESIEPGRVIGEAVGRGRRVLSSSLPEAPPATRHDYPHLGHLLGLGFEDVWLYEDERRPFEAGWYVAVEAVAASKEHGFAMFEQNLLVTEEGVELVTRCPARPWETN